LFIEVTTIDNDILKLNNPLLIFRNTLEYCLSIFVKNKITFFSRLKFDSLNVLFVFLTLTCLFFTYPVKSWAKKAVFSFDNYGIDQGLSVPDILKLAQDKQGFIWLATQAGLFRFDGYQFKVFKYSPSDPTSISDNYIENIFIDSKDRLWVSTRNGLNLFNRQSLSFKRFFHDPNNVKSLSNNHVMEVTEDHDGKLWVATWGGGLNHFYPESELFSHFEFDDTNENSLSDNQVYSVMVDSSNAVWVGTRDGGVNYFDQKNALFTRYLHDEANKNSLSHNKVYTLHEDIKGIIWIGTRGGGLNRFDPATKQFQRYQYDINNPDSISSNQIFSIFSDSNGSLWVGTYNAGVNRFDPINNRFDHYLHDAQDQHSLANNNVFSIIQDRSGLLWLGTLGGGISKFDPASENFGLVRHEATNPNGIDEGKVTSFYKNQSGELWIGTYSGLNHYIVSNDEFQRFEHQADNSESLCDSGVLAVLEDSMGTLWVGTLAGGLGRMNSDGKSFTCYRFQADNEHSLSDNYVAVLHEDAKGYLWVGTQNGLNRFNRDTDNFTRFHFDKNNTDSISDNFVNTLFTDKDDTLWIGTSGGGLNQFNEQNSKFTRFQHEPDNANSLSHNTVYSIAQDHDGNMWLGTNNGLNKFNPVSQKFVQFRENDGLANERVFAILVDKEGKLWLGLGEQSLSLFDPKTAIFIDNIDADAKCYSTQGAYFQSSDGQLFFGNESRYCAFYPENISQQSQAPDIVFTDFRLLNKSVAIKNSDNNSPLNRAINYTDSLILTHKDIVMSFEFSALHFASPTGNQYKYKLEGFNADWLETGADNRRATYTNLSAGDYVLKVIASNNQNVWNEQGREINLRILPPPWMTWWAYAIYVLALLSIIAWFIQSQRNKKKHLKVLVRERTKELQQAYSQLEEISLTDQLTGLRNRYFLMNNIDNDIAFITRKYKNWNMGKRIDKLQGADLIFFLIDLDHFKLVNDTYGHTAGDAVLIQFKDILEQVFRETDYLIRWGGEEFLVIARFTERNKAPELAERLRQTVESHDFDIGESKALNKTCSIGFACYPFSTQETEALVWSQVIDVADHCMYAAKKSNRNAWVGLNSTENSSIEDLFKRVMEQTGTLIQANELQMLSSISEHDKVHW